MIRNFFGASLLALTLTACGGSESGEKPTTDEIEGEGPVVIDVEEPDVIGDKPEASAGIEITRLLGTFEGEVTGLAFSRNPENVQNSTLLAANGTAGIALISTGDGGAASVYNAGGRKVTAIATGAMDGNTLIAFETAQSESRRLEIAAFNESRDDLVVIAFAELSLSPVKELCFAGTSIYRIDQNSAMIRFDLSLDAAGLSLDQSDKSYLPTTDCSASNNILELRSPGGKRSALNADGTDNSAPTPYAPEGSFGMVVMPTQDGAVSFYANTDGEVLVNDALFSFLIEGEPIDIRHLAAAPGNFGGVNRNGVMAVLTTDNQLGLVSWLSVANALGLPPLTDDRLGGDTAEEPDTSFTPQIELPILPPVEDQ